MKVLHVEKETFAIYVLQCLTLCHSTPEPVITIHNLRLYTTL